jgi:hypothetical protein
VALSPTTVRHDANQKSSAGSGLNRSSRVFQWRAFVGARRVCWLEGRVGSLEKTGDGAPKAHLFACDHAAPSLTATTAAPHRVQRAPGIVRMSWPVPHLGHGNSMYRSGRVTSTVPVDAATMIVRCIWLMLLPRDRANRAWLYPRSLRIVALSSAACRIFSSRCTVSKSRREPS